MNEIPWGGCWEHGCGAAGDAVWDDADLAPTSDHDCEVDDHSEVIWYGEWVCHGCGAGSDDTWADGGSPHASHACEQDEELAQRHGYGR
ncbi:hypothetical protein E1265_35695 [Streptomyces sp. 8K308]|uniref:hypothetical protein n=1 Tax=Streptomyces sp. 8K308 TaxID=2530388 RepID=UPI00104C18DD|nr:hypothetical protein [Streptomyces sp. 8K308]TDC04969.1 hypothetical protein E1265_35695 [Streptomyces sp. 8K308]